MASVFRRKRLVAGKAVTATKYTVQYTDASGKVRRVSGFTDKQRSLDLARSLETGAASADQVKHRKTPLADHLNAYKLHLESKDDDAKHVRQTVARINSILSGCEFAYVRDVNLSTLENWLAEQRDAKTFSTKTGNYYARDFRSFLTWLVKSKRSELNPLTDWQPLKIKSDDGRERRTLTIEQFGEFINAAVRGPSYRRLSGFDRVVLYIVAVQTGLRANELASLTVESFDLDAGIVTVKAASSKRRKTDRQPLRPDLVDFLRPWLAERSGKVWPGSWRYTSAAMVQIDLKAAEIPYVEGGRFFDFHALRHQYITDLTRAGVSPKVTQQLARHSTITLTMDRYSHLVGNEAAEALELLPALPVASLTQNLTQTRDVSCQNVAQGGTSSIEHQEKEAGHNSMSSLYLSHPVVSCHDNSQEAPVRVELTLADLQSFREV